ERDQIQRTGDPGGAPRIARRQPHNGFGPGSCHASPIGSLPSEDVRRTVAAHYLTAPGSQARAVQTTAPAAQREGRPSPATSTQTTAPTARAKDSPVPPPSARPG